MLSEFFIDNVPKTDFYMLSSLYVYCSWNRHLHNSVTCRGLERGSRFVPGSHEFYRECKQRVKWHLPSASMMYRIALIQNIQIKVIHCLVVILNVYRYIKATALWLFLCLSTALATWQGNLSLSHLVVQLGQSIWLCHLAYQFVIRKTWLNQL